MFEVETRIYGSLGEVHAATGISALLSSPLLPQANTHTQSDRFTLLVELVLYSRLLRFTATSQHTPS